MLEVLQFVFSGFWVWLGTVILIATVAQGIASTIAALRQS